MPGAIPALIGFIGLCLLVAAADGAVTAANLHGWYLSLTPPPGNPPNWAFGAVWSVLYVLIGMAAWLVWRDGGANRALRLWGWQLLVNALWVPAFFGLHQVALGLGVILLLLALVIRTIFVFARHQALAASLLVPYAIWICYATYLNAGYWWLNR